MLIVYSRIRSHDTMCRLRATRDDFGARSLPKSTWFRTRNKVADGVRGPRTNIKTHHRGAFEYWLGYLCNSRAKLIKIRQEILDFKKKFIV